MADTRIRNLFNFFNKSSAASQAIVQFVGPGMPVYRKRNFETFAKEGFEANVYVYRAVMTIANSAAGIPWILTRKRGKRPVDEHEILDLLKRPNPEQGGGEFMTALVAYWIASGNSYCEAVGPTSREAPPKELYTLRPDRMTVVAASRGSGERIKQYNYEVGAWKQEFKPQQIMHLKLFSMLDDWYGLSPIAVAGRVIDQMNAGNDWNTAMLQNSARPSGALVTPGIILPDQFERLRTIINEQYSGSKNANRPMILENGLDWKAFGINPSDMDWLNGKTQNAREIAIALGVPPEMLGDSANKTHANYDIARKSFYEETMLPLMDNLRDRLNMWLTPRWDDKFELDYDRDQIEALQEDRTAVWQRVGEAWKDGRLTQNESREEMGFERYDEADVLFVPTSSVPLHQALAAADDAVEQGDQTNVLKSQEVEKGKLSIDQMGLTNESQRLGLSGETPEAQMAREKLEMEKEQHALGKESHAIDKAERLRNALNGNANKKGATQKKSLPFLKAPSSEITSRAGAYATEFDHQRDRWYAKLEQRVETQFKADADAVYERLVELERPATVTPILTVIQATMASRRPQWVSLIRTMGYSVADDFGGRTASFFQKKAMDDIQETAGAWIEANADQKTRAILKTTTKQLSEQAEVLFESREGMIEFATEIRSTFLNMADHRTRVIAKAEVVAASNLGAQVVARKMGVPVEKEWFSLLDPWTRDAHEHAHGQRRPLDEPYHVGEERLMFPGDATLGASASNIINCRCVEVYHPVFKAEPQDGDERQPYRQEIMPNRATMQGQSRTEQLLRREADRLHADDVFDETPASDLSATQARVADDLAVRLRDMPEFVRFAQDRSAGLYSQNLTTSMVAELMQTWALGSRTPLMYALQRAAQLEFGLTFTKIRLTRAQYEMGEAIYREYLGGLRAFVRAQYAHTQAWLKAHRINKLYAFRGQRFGPNFAYEEALGRSALQLQPLSSFSTFMSVATNYVGKNGLIYSAEIPAGRIFSLPLTGLGNLKQGEIVVIAGSGSAWARVVRGVGNYDDLWNDDYMEAIKEWYDEVGQFELEIEDEPQDDPSQLESDFSEIEVGEP